MNYLQGANDDGSLSQDELNAMSDHDYIQNMDRSSGILGREQFSSPFTSQYTNHSKNVVKQLYDLYKSGDPDVVSQIRDYELSQNAPAYTNNEAGHKLLMDSLSKDTVNRNTLWDLFYQAHQKYMGSKLYGEGEDAAKFGSPEYNELANYHGFDMGGRNRFDFESLQHKLNIPGVEKPSYTQPSGPQPFSFDRLFQSGQ